jgi:carboxyl-terminal processing protease
MLKWIKSAGLSLVISLSYMVVGAVPPKTISSPLEKLEPMPDHPMTARYVMSYLVRSHYYRPAVDDQLSEKIYDKFLETLDSTRSYFTQKDIDIFNTYRHKLDDAIKQNDLTFAYDLFNLYQERVKDRIVFALKTLDDSGVKRFDFNKEEFISLDREDADWEPDTKALDKLWFKRLKSTALNLKIGHEERDLAAALDKASDNMSASINKIQKEPDFAALDSELQKLVVDGGARVWREQMKLLIPQLSQKSPDAKTKEVEAFFNSQKNSIFSAWVKAPTVAHYSEKLRNQGQQKAIETALEFTSRIGKLWLAQAPFIFSEFNKATQDRLKEINETLTKRYQNQLNRLHQVNSEDAFQTYINSITQTYDPHTQYFSPRTSENFNINMSLSLQGIGAVLQMEDEYTKVQRLIPAGPAEKMGQLNPEDRIIGVGQGNKGEVVDVIGWRLDEVVDLIRGPKGSIVRLEILPKSSQSSKIINITRDEIKLEEQSAKSEVIELKRGKKIHKIGVIDIPAFYADFKAQQENRADYNSTSRDVKKLLLDMKKQGIDGLVIDLRNNGGGSLQEVQNLTGFFIPKGPVVQVRNPFGHVEVLSDDDDDVIYDGPMTVIVNRLSASASEIFAGAMQDYGRALVVGSQTFGKGTVQGLQPLNKGQLKITQAKFYRVSGGSTQHQGVIPDLSFPELYDKEKIGESALEQALPWDTIRAAQYKPVAEYKALIPQLKLLHEDRVRTNPDFIFIEKQLALASALDERTELTLNEHERRSERLHNEHLRLLMENERRVSKHLPLLVDFEDYEKTKLVSEDSNEKDIDTEQDAVLVETGEILLDYTQLSNYPQKPLYSFQENSKQ